MNEFARWLASKKQPPTPAPAAKAVKPRKPLRRVSDKRKKLMAKVGPEREARKEETGCCMICRKPFPPELLDGDEIARGADREKCLSQPSLTIISCRKCHTESQDWPIAKRIAVVIRWTIDQAAALYNELRGTAPTHVMGEDVITYLMFRKRDAAKTRKKRKAKVTEEGR